MSTDHRTPTEIERDIERERAGLTDTLDTLQEKFSVDNFVHQIGDQLRENGGEISRSVARSVKENPVALAVTGIGLAWMIFGKGRDDRSTVRDRMTAGPDYDAVRDTGTPRYRRSSGVSGGNGHGPAAGQSYNSRREGPSTAPRYRHEPSWARQDDGHDDDGTSFGERARNAGSAIGDAAGSARDSVADAGSAAASGTARAAAKAGSAASGAAASAASGIASAASGTGSAIASAGRGVADTARSGRDSVASGLSAARRHISDGTETLSQEARVRVIAAREKAVAARDQAEQAARRAGATASDFFDDQPLVAGLLAMAAGAAIAGTLPRTRIEDENLGDYSDSLMEEAERIFREETEKAKSVATTAADEARKVARETKDDLDSGAPGDKSAAQAIADKIKSDSKRVADAAKDEADKQKLGKANT